MSQTLEPGSVPAWDGQDPANQIASIFADETWPVLSQLVLFNYPTVAARDAALPSPGPTARYKAFVTELNQITCWNGSVWVPMKGHAGSSTIPASGTDTAARTMTNVFPAGLFATTPVVSPGNAGASYNITVSGVSTTGFTITAKTIDGSNITSPVTFFWNASQV